MLHSWPCYCQHGVAPINQGSLVHLFTLDMGYTPNSLPTHCCVIAGLTLRRFLKFPIKNNALLGQGFPFPVMQRQY